MHRLSKANLSARNAAVPEMRLGNYADASAERFGLVQRPGEHIPQ